MSITFGKRAPLTWRIEEIGSIPTVIWSNGARRPAGELELELWREREQLLSYVARWAIAGEAIHTLMTGRNARTDGPPDVSPPEIEGDEADAAADIDAPVEPAAPGSVEVAAGPPAASTPPPPRVNAQAALAANLKDKHRDKLLALRKQRQSEAGAADLAAAPGAGPDTAG